MTLHCHDVQVRCPLVPDYDGGMRPYKDGRLRPDNNPGNAFWCDEHGHNRLECTKNKKHNRGRCHGPAIRGTNACKMHSGSTRAVAIVKGEAQITAWSALGDTAKTVDHKLAVMAVLHMSWLRLAAYSEMLRQQALKNESPMVPFGTQPIGQLEPAQDGESPSPKGLIGYRFGAAGKDGNIFAQNEEIRALVKLEADERDRVVRYAKAAHDMGISDRLTNLAEKWGDIVATRVTLVLDGLHLTAEQEALVPALITRHLADIDIGMGETAP